MLACLELAVNRSGRDAADEDPGRIGISHSAPLRDHRRLPAFVTAVGSVVSRSRPKPEGRKPPVTAGTASRAGAGWSSDASAGFGCGCTSSWPAASAGCVAIAGSVPVPSLRADAVPRRESGSAGLWVLPRVPPRASGRGAGPGMRRRSPPPPPGTAVGVGLHPPHHGLEVGHRAPDTPLDRSARVDCAGRHLAHSAGLVLLRGPYPQQPAERLGRRPALVHYGVYLTEDRNIHAQLVGEPADRP